MCPVFGAMKRIYDRHEISALLDMVEYADVLKPFWDRFFITEYEKGELASYPFMDEALFQIVIQGYLNIYFIRDDGSVHSLSNGGKNYLLGEMELFSSRVGNVYAEASTDLVCLSLPIEKSRDSLLADNAFLKMVSSSLVKKMEAVTAFDAAPAGLSERVLIYMRFMCPNMEIRGLQKAAFRLNCSVRQLQRIFNSYEMQGVVVKIGKGAYRLVCVNAGKNP